MDFGSLQPLIDAVQGIGSFGLLVIAIVAAYKRWIIFKGEFDAIVADRDLWRQMALDHLQIADRAAAAAEKAVDVRAASGR